MLKLKSISPSRIKTYDMCKFKYYLTYHCHNVVLKSNWGAVIGTLIHDILEQYSIGQDLDWENRLLRGYAGTLETKDKENKPVLEPSPLRLAKAKDFNDKKPYCDVCEYVLKHDGICGISHEPLNKLTGCPKDLFLESRSIVQKTITRYTSIWDKMLKLDGVPVGAEYNFKINISHVPMIGIMDLVIEESPETIHIMDYKTGSWTQDYEECRKDIQVRMYSLAARREFIDDVNNKGFKYKNVILTFDYFTDKPITLAFTKEEDLLTEKYVIAKIKEIESTDLITRIVKHNEEFADRKAWKCRSLCDTEVCASRWTGVFRPAIEG